MATSLAYKHQLRALARWPRDALRPECQFHAAMQRRAERRFQGAAVSEKAELEQANALYSLLENRYSRKYHISGSLMEPASHPTYYKDLVRELEEAPQRSWVGRLVNRWKGVLRFS